MPSKLSDNCEKSTGGEAFGADTGEAFGTATAAFFRLAFSDGLLRALFLGKKVLCLAAASIFGSFLMTVNALFFKLYLYKCANVQMHEIGKMCK